jgi:hypothetical protein
LYTEPHLLEVLSTSIYMFLTQALYPMYQYQFLFEFGLAQFQKPNEVEIAEPLALISIINYFESKGKILDHNILTWFQYNKGVAFRAVLLAMTKLLQNQ